MSPFQFHENSNKATLRVNHRRKISKTENTIKQSEITNDHGDEDEEITNLKVIYTPDHGSGVHH